MCADLQSRAQMEGIAVSEAFIEDLLIYEHFESLAIQAVTDDWRSRGLTSQAEALRHDGWIHLEHLKKLRIQYAGDLAKCESKLDEYVLVQRVSEALQNDMTGFDKAYPAVLKVRLELGRQADSIVPRLETRRP